MSNFTRPFLYGQQPIRRENPEEEQSEWYYLDPRNGNSFADMKTIDVPTKDTPNPYAEELQQYWYENDPNSYREHYGNAEPPQVAKRNSSLGKFGTIDTLPENVSVSPWFSNTIQPRQKTPYWPNSATDSYISSPNFGLERDGIGITTDNKRTVYRSLSGFRANNQEWYDNNPQKDNINFIEDEYETNPLVNDCLKSSRFRGFMDYLYQSGVEGEGYENAPKK